VFGGPDSAVVATHVLLLSLAAVPLLTQLSPAGLPPPCELSDCLKRINAAVSITVLDASQRDLVGPWSSGAGLSGVYLYLFEDGSYIYTEWADILPETIYDKGHWRVVDGVVALSSDADVNWERPGREGRFLIFRITGAREQLLLGLDFRFAIFESVVHETPRNASGYLRAASLARRRQWKPGDGEREKKRLMKDCWSPEYFTSK
jgi:hypothetical protein